MILYISFLFLFIVYIIQYQENFLLNEQKPLSILRRMNLYLSKIKPIAEKKDIPMNIEVNVQTLPITQTKKEGFKAKQLQTYLNEINNQLKNIKHDGNKNPKINLDIQI